MQLFCPEAAQEARPGQFIMLQVSEGTDPLLRRPFSLCSAEGASVELLYRVLGKGTAIMAQWEPEQEVNFIGPLGQGFIVPHDIGTAHLVAGGMGVAPLLFLAQRLGHTHSTIQINLFMGGKGAEEVSVLDDFKQIPADMFFATESGTRGYHGLVTGLFSHYLQNNSLHNTLRGCIFGCGPLRMMKELNALALHYSLGCQVSLESHMACGIGSCLGCAVKAGVKHCSSSSDGQAHEYPPHQYQRVCTEGPVFESRDLVWDD